MAWVVQCPKHGKVIEEYHYDAIKKLELHSEEKRESGEQDKTILYELDEEQIRWEDREERIMSCSETMNN